MSFMEYGGVQLNLINLIVTLIVTWTKCTVLHLIIKKWYSITVIALVL